MKIISKGTNTFIVRLRTFITKFPTEKLFSISASALFFGLVCFAFYINPNKVFEDSAEADLHKIIGNERGDRGFSPWPNIAWLMTFPNSGTIYTTQLVQTVAGVSTATNFGNEVGLLGFDYLDNPEYSYGPNGPFRAAKKPFPPKYILTKTHCSGHDIYAIPTVITPTTEKFIQDCATGVKENVNRKPGERPNVGVRYDAKIVRKAVHLIRNPFDNVVARFHFAASRHQVNMGQNRDTAKFVRLPDENWAYSNDPEGFRAWCRDLDAKIEKDYDVETIYGQDIADLINNVPCHGHFRQYIHWHNRASASSKYLNIPSFPLHYEDFHFRQEEVVDELLKFLEVPQNGTIFPFLWKGSYELEYFTERERLSIYAFVKMMASTPVNNLLSRYFQNEMS